MLDMNPTSIKVILVAKNNPNVELKRGTFKLKKCRLDVNQIKKDWMIDGLKWLDHEDLEVIGPLAAKSDGYSNVSFEFMDEVKITADSHGTKASQDMVKSSDIYAKKKPTERRVTPTKSTQKAVQSGVKSSTTSVTMTGLDDLEKLADLRDAGILTDEEFQAKKKQILGL